MIDVLLAAYNGEKYIRQQLDSVLNQKVSVPFRVLVSDDGSTDDTLAILKSYGEQLTIVKNIYEKGAKNSFLSLLKQCTGPYAALCDQDDIWEEDKLQRVYDAMVAENTVQPCLIHTDLSVVDGGGQQIYPSFFAHQGFDSKAVTLNRLLVQNNATGCTMLLNRPLIDLVVQAEPEKIYMHDWWIALTAAAFGKVICLKDKTVRYRQHGKNAIGASRKGLLSRALKAFSIRKKLKKRIAVTYDQTAVLLNCYGDKMTKEKNACLRFYLAIEKQNKFERIANLKRGAYTMQNPLQRAGHLWFL